MSGVPAGTGRRACPPGGAGAGRCRFRRPPFVNSYEGRRGAGPDEGRAVMREYLLAVHMVEGEPRPPEDQVQRMYKAVDAFNAEVQSAGAWVFAGGRHTHEPASVVRSQNGQVITTDRPFAETKEQLGGFWVIQAADLDAALAWAAKGSEACGAPVEVRPFQETGEE